MDGGVDVDRDGGEGGADLDGHQDMKLEGPASALEEVSTPVSESQTSECQTSECQTSHNHTILKMQH